jgi:hypothetical protein
MPLSPDAVTDTSTESKREDAVAVAEAILARARADCIAAGVTPAQLAKLLLPEALLALMIEGLDEGQTRAVFARFADDQIGEWYARVRGAAERCDCAIDHASDLRATERTPCASSSARRGCGTIDTPSPADTIATIRSSDRTSIVTLARGNASRR